MKKSPLIAKFNKRATQWLQDIDRYSEGQIVKNPAIATWSLTELYDHIMRVARTYQIPNFLKSMTTDARLKKRKNFVGMAIFDLGIRRQVKIKMEEFPAPLVENFTPVKQSKKELISDFKKFISEVNDLEKQLTAADPKNRHYHPMFGNISSKEWFALIEIHLSHHEGQRKRIMEYVDKNAKTSDG